MHSTDEPRFKPEDIRCGDWIKYKSGYGGGRVAEVHAVAPMGNNGIYVITDDGNVPLRQVIEVRRLPINVVALDRRQ